MRSNPIKAYKIDFGTSVSATGTATTNHAIPTLSDGVTKPKYAILTCAGSAGVQIAVGDSTVDANTDPQFGLVLGMNPVCIHVFQAERISIRNDDAGDQDVYIAYLADY